MRIKRYVDFALVDDDQDMSWQNPQKR